MQLNSLKTIYDKLHQVSKQVQNLIFHFHLKLEAGINKTSEPDAVKIKKKMLLYYVYTTILYSVCLPFFNSYSSIWHGLVYTLIAVAQGFMIKIKNHYILTTYFIFYTFLSIYLPVTRDDELLKAVGVALMHHNLFFLFPDFAPLKVLYIAFSLFFLNNTQERVRLMFEDGRYDVVESMIKNFYLTWPLIYVVNHFSSLYLTGIFQRTMRENKKIENELKRMNIKLIETNEKLNHTMYLLEKKNQELNDALKGRELFLAGFSHELRNPLNSMLGNVELVRLELQDKKLISMLDTCKLCGEVLLALINNVLDVAKINAEKLELQFLPENFLKMLEKVWGISTIRMKQRGLKGELYVSNNFPKYIDMDSHRFMQVLLNLLGNSTKFTKEGFIKLIVTWHENQGLEELNEPHVEYVKLLQKSRQSIKTDEATDAPNSGSSSRELHSPCEIQAELELAHQNYCRSIHPKFLSHMLASQCSYLSIDDLKLRRGKLRKVDAYEKRQGVIKIEIIDTGCGISPSSLDKLFQPFCQADSSITRRFGGTGLGLYITKQIVEKMGGNIHVSSQEGVGSNFCLLVPSFTASKKEAQVQACKEENEEDLLRKVSASRLRTMVIGDDLMNKVLADYMKKLGVEATVMNSGEDALSKLLKGDILKKYSFLMVDSQTPEIDGLEVCRRIRKYETATQAHQNIPIVIVSGTCTEKERFDCLDCKGDIKALCFYRKPFSYGDCKRSISLILREQKHSNNRRPIVLVVDDDPFNTTVIKEYLEKNGFLCDTCGNGKDAVKKVSMCKYNAVVIDYEMPEMDGLTATTLIKKNFPKLFIIGMTGNIGDEYVTKGMRSGMNRVELKPIDFQKVIKMIWKETVF